MEFNSKVPLLFVFFLFIACCGCTTTSTQPPSTIQAGEPREISGPMTISQPGLYQLKQDVIPTSINKSKSGSCLCFQIRSSDVIFDGMGHVIDGSKINPPCPEWSDGFYVKDQAGNQPKYPNIVIRNVTVSNWQGGIEFHGVHEFTLENVTVTGSNNGISFDGSSNVHLFNNTVTKNAWVGVWGRDNENVVLSGNTITDNRNWGINLNGLIESPVEINLWGRRFFLTPYSTINKNSTSGNSNHIYRNEIGNNRNGGIYIANSEGIIIEENNIHDSRGDGIWLENVDNTKIFGNTIVNSYRAIFLHNCGPDLILTNNTLFGNKQNMEIVNNDESVPLTIIIGTLLVYLLKVLAGTSKIFSKIGSIRIIKRISGKFRDAELRVTSVIPRSRVSAFFEGATTVSILGAVILGGLFTYNTSFGHKAEIFLLLTMIGGIVIVTPKAVQFFVSQRLGMQAEYRMWWGGILIMILTTILLRTVFGQPIRTEVVHEESTDKKKLAFARLAGPLVSILLSSVFLLLYMMKGIFASLALYGLEMSLLSALVLFLPISPMDGEQVYKWNKIVWALLFLPVFIGYGYLLMTI